MKSPHRWIAALTVATLWTAAGTASAHQVTHGDLTLAHPFVQLNSNCPGDAGTHGQVMLIINAGRQADRLVAADLDRAGQGQLIRWSTVDGKARRQVLADGIDIPAGGRVAVMLPALEVAFPKSRSALMEGGAAQGSLTFRRSGKLPVTFMVDAAHQGPSASGCGAAAPTSVHHPLH